MARTKIEKDLSKLYATRRPLPREGYRPPDPALVIHNIGAFSGSALLALGKDFPESDRFNPGFEILIEKGGEENILATAKEVRGRLALVLTHFRKSNEEEIVRKSLGDASNGVAIGALPSRTGTLYDFDVRTVIGSAVNKQLSEYIEGQDEEKNKREELRCFYNVISGSLRNLRLTFLHLKRYFSGLRTDEAINNLEKESLKLILENEISNPYNLENLLDNLSIILHSVLSWLEICLERSIEGKDTESINLQITILEKMLFTLETIYLANNEEIFWASISTQIKCFEELKSLSE